MAILTKPITAEELELRPQSDAHVELVKGEVITSPPSGHEHGKIAGNIFVAIHRHLLGEGLGSAYAAGTGFILSRDPDTVRAPDAAFVSRERVEQQQRKEGFFEGAPELAVEVSSPPPIWKKMWLLKCWITNSRERAWSGSSVRAPARLPSIGP